MGKIRIVATAEAMPRKVEGNEKKFSFADASEEWIKTFQGNWQRKFCTTESCQTMAVEAAQKALMSSGIPKEEIGLVLVATTSSDHVFPNLAVRVQNALGLKKEVISFNVGAAGTGFQYGMEICQSLLEHCQKKYALLIGSEQMSNITEMADRSICVLKGSGAQAAVLTI